MKHSILVFACLFALCLSSSCEKAQQIHLISAHTWVVTELSTVSNFAQIGDELTFLDNRLFFNHSNGIETDGQWNFLIKNAGGGPIVSYDMKALSITSNFSYYEFSIVNLTTEVLEISTTTSNFGALTVRLEAKE